MYAKKDGLLFKIEEDYKTRCGLCVNKKKSS